MNDNIIINIISKTYSSIVSFFIFIFSLLFTGFILLQNGLFLDELSIANVHIKQLYIKWNNKIDVSAKEIYIRNQSSANTQIDYKSIQKSFKFLSHSKVWFGSVVCDKIYIGGATEASFRYLDAEDGFFKLTSDDLSLNSSISFKGDILHLSIEDFINKSRKIHINGDIYFTARKLEAYSNLHVNIGDDALFHIFSKATTEKLFYRLKSKKQIINIQHLIKIANLPKDVLYWAYDAINMSYVDVTNAYGFLEYRKLQNAYKNLTLEATVYDVDYTYNPKLDAVHAKKVLLEFKNGILNIIPNDAYSYNMYLNKSWLNIDFTKAEELLTLYLLFDGKLNNDMLKILNTYKIKLPFKQNSGSVNTDLKIVVGLRSIAVNAKGKFFTKAANFDYLGLKIDIYNALIELDNFDVSVKKMDVKYKNIAKAKVDVNYNAQSSKGSVKFLFSDINVSGMALQAHKKPLEAIYTIDPDSDSISIQKSTWNYDGNILYLDALILPFDLGKLQVNIPATLITLNNIGTSYISGSVDLNSMETQLHLDILKFKYDGIEFSQSNTPIEISFKDKISIYAQNSIHFTLGGSKYLVKRFYVDVEKNIVNLKHTSIEIGKYITTKIYAKYNTETKKSHISLTNFVLKDPNSGKVLYDKSKIILSAKTDREHIAITSKELDANFVSQDSGWRLTLNSIGRISHDSELLQKFQIDKGNFTLYKNTEDKYTRFTSNLIYPYKILVKNNIPTENYKVKGRIYKEKVYVDINDMAHIEIKDAIDINMGNSILNIQEALRAIKDIGTTDEKSSGLDITAKAKNSYLYVNKERKILYDSIDMQYYNKILTAQLQHDNGSAGLRLEKNNFHLYGQDFNDEFMDSLFALSDFSQGDLSFSIDGNTTTYGGALYVQKTTIKDYKILNNILAFVNTIPSLVTFSVPGYSKDGLYINQAYLNFKSNKNVFDLTDIFLDSKEIDILGKGVIDIENDDLDVTLNLKTDLGSGLAKVPLVGHILLNKDSISTTLKIKGKIADPSVESLLAQEIVVAPINIIKRTISLPYNFLEKVITDATQERNSTKK